jgi:hypothetical protein
LLFNGLRIYLTTFFLVTFYASASLAVVNDPGLPFDTAAQTMPPTNMQPINISASINSECFTGYYTNFQSVITALERNDVPVGSVKESFEATAAIALHRHGDKIIWSLAPSLDKVSLNPIEDIKNLHVLLQHRF